MTTRCWCEVETVCITGIPLVAFMVWCTEYVKDGDTYRDVAWLEFIRCECATFATFDTDPGELCNIKCVG